MDRSVPSVSLAALYGNQSKMYVFDGCISVCVYGKQSN